MFFENFVYFLSKNAIKNVQFFLIFYKNHVQNGQKIFFSYLNSKNDEYENPQEIHFIKLKDNSKVHEENQN